MIRIRSFSPAVWSVLAAGILVAVVALAATSPLLAQEEASSLTVSKFHVEGMTCGGCEVGVRMVVKKLDGVEDVEADYEEGSAVVTYESDKVTADDIIAAIADLGYTAELAADEDDEDTDTEGSPR